MTNARAGIGSAVVALALLAGACSSSHSSARAPSGPAATDVVDPAQKTAPARFAVAPGTQEVTVTAAAAKDRLSLVDRSGVRLLTLRADRFGQAHFSYVPTRPGQTFQTGGHATLPTTDGHDLGAGEYTIRDEDTSPVQATAPFRVRARDEHPPAAFYDRQAGHIGPSAQATTWYGYITMRDGVTLSANVRLPGPASMGPYPTVVEYSGYGPSNPGATEPGSMIAGLLGYATVGVNMRGTGCSGGVFDVFNPAQQADGYDVIEAVARQPWVLNHKPGMVGLSYSGITQLYVASTRPPHLAAVTALSVIKDPWLEQWPGGVYNGGFTKQWLAERDRESSAGGTSWVQLRLDALDRQCTAHQRLREQDLDFQSFGRSLVHRPPDADARDLSKLVRQIDVPVYLTGAWQDEQTGPQFTDMLDHFDHAPVKRFTLFNGRHPDGYTPLVLTRWYEFLELFVHRKVPRLSPAIRAAAPAVFQQNFGVAGLQFEPDRFGRFTDAQYPAVLAAYEAEPPVRVLFESGAGGTVAGSPQARFETTFPSWPPPQATLRTWYLGAGGTLTDTRPAAPGVDRFANAPADGTKTFFGPKGYQLLDPTWDFNWQPYAPGAGLSYLTAPMPHDIVVAGAARANLWVSADDSDADVQVSVSVVRPDGVEYLVSSGLLRLGDRKASAVHATPADLRLDRTYSAVDYAPVPQGQFVEASIEIPAFAQAFRTGDRLRIMISSPGRDFGAWAFETIGRPGAARRIGRQPGQLSSFQVALVDGIAVPPGLPPCPSLRGQACRPYRAIANQAG